MKKYEAPELILSSYILSNDVAINLGSNIWEDNDLTVDDNTEDGWGDIID